jgi:ParB family chromosome partitioning protein
LIPEIRKYWAEDDNNQLIISQLEKKGLKVYLLDDVELIEEPMEPTMGTIKIECQHYDYSEDELKAEFEEAIDNYKEELETYNSAKENEFVNGIVFHPKTYVHKEVFLKIIEDSKTETSTYSEPMAKRKMADCTPEEQIVKINERETRKRHIEHNKQFEVMVQMIRETDYIHKKKTLSVDEMVAFSLTLFENNVDYVGRQKYFSKLLGNTSKMTDVETVEHFKKNFKKDIFCKLIRYILTKQVHFGESNHVNNLTNISFYNAVQGYYKTKIANIEKEYTEERNKREARLKERIGNLEKQIQELTD